MSDFHHQRIKIKRQDDRNPTTFSIIIPIYNRFSTLNRCLDSIVQQKFSDFECILIDDGSTDKSYETCKSYAEKDDRFIALTKSNGGVGSARNMGLDYAKGEWIVFIDSDDTITPNHLANFFQGCQDDTDIVFGGYQEKTNGLLVRENSYDDGIYTNRNDIVKFLITSKALENMGPCDKIYRRSIIDSNKLRFDTQLSLSEDRLFVYEFLCICRGIASVNKATYIVNRDDSKSLSHTLPSRELSIARFVKLGVATKKLANHYNLQDNEIAPFFKYMATLLISAMDNLYDAKKGICHQAATQKKFFNDYFDSNFYNKYKNAPEVVRMYRENKNLQILLSQQFIKYDLRKLWKWIKSKF